MERLKFSSPGVLLILAALTVGMTLLLDICVLRPHLERQKAHALCESADRAQGNVQRAMASEARRLSDLCRTLCGAGDPRASVTTKTPLSAVIRTSSRLGNIDVVWVCDTDGRVLHASPDNEELFEIEIPSTNSGLMRLRGVPVIFARQDIPDPGRDPGLSRQLYVARKLNAERLAEIGSAIPGDLLLVRAGDWPTTGLLNGSSERKVWLHEPDRLAVAWPVKGAAGNNTGYFLARFSVAQIHMRSAAVTRTVLTLLWASGCTVVLVIVGASIFLANPASRLLGRLHRVAGGAHPTEGEFTRDLHAEPLVLAKKLHKVFETITDAARIDPLTGLASRWQFEQMLELTYRQARRYHHSLSAIVMDVDLFKAINDTRGHQAGDEVLKVIGRIIREYCRDADVPARIGGDEFAILLPETSSAGAVVLAERIRNAVAAETLTVKSSEVKVTVSTGIADFDAGNVQEPRELVALADKALYVAKQRGRNCSMQAHDMAESSWLGGQEEGERVTALRGKLTGLDTQFKDLFMRSLQEIVQVLECRDAHMGNHARKVQHYSVLIARRMGLAEDVIKRVELSALLHDIGMMALPDSILLCQGRLDEGQLETMRRHPLLGARVLAGVEFLREAIPVVRSHHERFDGNGYPDGLAGQEISLSARIVAVADVFDAMTSPRTFRSARSVPEAINEICEGASSQFDTHVVAALVAQVDMLDDKMTGLALPGPPAWDAAGSGQDAEHRTEVQGTATA